MTKNQRKRLFALMGKTDKACDKVMGEEFCQEHGCDCEKCLVDFMQILFENTETCKCQWCSRAGCGEYHSKCKYYEEYRQKMEQVRHDKNLKRKCKYFSVNGRGV